ncbi:hypothetical protein AFCDBAGC_4433 [Methylobacterium cerastii]|uniref:Uncharacterized protein n=1 Tax=Methylobacterium cerastii TaxID=932741 RepID=A0ABQ4QPA6_9HYPH|nr:hypothetical protein AFCDBAGC_4433 [Methylobacterium cerastii]
MMALTPSALAWAIAAVPAKPVTNSTAIPGYRLRMSM